MANKYTQLGEANIRKLLLRLSFPSMIAMFANALYNIVDTIFVGRGVGSVGIAAVAIVLPIVAIISSFAHLMGVHQAMGQAKEAFILAIQRWILLIVPLILILPNLMATPIDGVWLAFPIADLVAALVALFILYRTFKHKGIIR